MENKAKSFELDLNAKDNNGRTGFDIIAKLEANFYTIQFPNSKKAKHKKLFRF